MNANIKGLFAISTVYIAIMCLAHVVFHILFKIPISQYMIIMTYIMFMLGVSLGAASMAHYIDSGARQQVLDVISTKESLKNINDL